MKKSYISPSTEVILLHTENVGAMTMSLYKFDEGGEEQLSNKREQDSNPIWGSENTKKGGLWN